MKQKTVIDMVAKEITNTLADNGQLIEAGFAAIQHLISKLPEPLPPDVHARMLFMGGAEHLFASIMTMLDPGADPTDRDMRNMQLIHSELEVFRVEFEKRVPI